LALHWEERALATDDEASEQAWQYLVAAVVELLLDGWQVATDPI